MAENNNINNTMSEHKRQLEKKARQIIEVLESPTVDLWKLRGLAISQGGLVNDAIRRRAWPKLSGLHERIWDDTRSKSARIQQQQKQQDTTPKKSNRKFQDRMTVQKMLQNERRRPPRVRRDSSTSNDDNTSVSSTHSLRDKVLASSLDFTQIELDVARCTWHLLTGNQRNQQLQMDHKRNRKVARLIRRKQRRLANLINMTLVQSYKRFSGDHHMDNTLRYYQGFHDVACIVLSTLSGSSPVRLRKSMAEKSSSLEGVAIATGLEMPAAVLLQVSQSHFRDCMRVNFSQLQTTLRLVLFPLIAYFDPPVHDFLLDCEMEPFFCLSWVITWFSHDIRDTQLTKRLFDFFLVSHPLMPIYMAVAMVCHPLNRQDVLQTECDFALVHQTLATLPRNSSMVGWKYQPGDGYVSDDDHDVDDDSSLGMDSQRSVDTEFLLQEEAMQAIRGEDHLGAEAISTVSSSMSTLFEARVPFQELIDTATHYMERMPPRDIIDLATRYYGRNQVQRMLDQAPGMIFLNDPPTWTRASYAKSDRALKQLRRKVHFAGEDDESSLSSKKLLLEDEAEQENDVSALLIFAEKEKSLAAVAAGCGPGGDKERRRKRRRDRIVFGAMVVAVAVVAIGVGVYMQQRGKEPKILATSAMGDGYPGLPNPGRQDGTRFHLKSLVGGSNERSRETASLSGKGIAVREEHGLRQHADAMAGLALVVNSFFHNPFLRLVLASVRVVGKTSKRIKNVLTLSHDSHSDESKDNLEKSRGRATLTVSRDGPLPTIKRGSKLPKEKKSTVASPEHEATASNSGHENPHALLHIHLKNAVSDIGSIHSALFAKLGEIRREHITLTAAGEILSEVKMAVQSDEVHRAILGVSGHYIAPKKSKKQQA